MVCGTRAFDPSIKPKDTLRGDKNRGSCDGDVIDCSSCESDNICCDCDCDCGCGCGCCDCGCDGDCSNLCGGNGNIAVVITGAGGGDCGPTLSSRVPLFDPWSLSWSFEPLLWSWSA